MKRMKEEQLRRMAMLSQQYDASIAEMIERQNVSIYLLPCFFFLYLIDTLCAFSTLVLML